MESPFLLLILLPVLIQILPTQSKLSPNYYQKSCPQFPKIIQEIVTSKQIASPTTAAATLRLFFHDCMVEGCDASLLITSNSFNTSERDSEVDHSLPGDGFDVITRAKTAIELQCPGIVSCADILAVAARNLVTIVGGPHYEVPLGRKDSLISNASRVEESVPKPLDSLTAKNSATEYSISITRRNQIQLIILNSQKD